MSETRRAAEVLVGPRLLRTFEGLEPTPEILAAIAAGRTSGVTIFRARNVGSPEQLRRLSAALQDARPAGDPPLVIGLDQEGGQLQAVGYGATAWPGNLALGATGSADLARRAGRAIAREAAAMGATLVFGPVCDVLRPVSATPLGSRPFGSSPALVAGLAAAMAAGIGETGILATLKHFPGHGAAVGDSHAAMPVVSHSPAEFDAVDLPPFRAAIAAGAAAVLPGHLGVPALNGGDLVSATVSRAILDRLLRRELGFAGITVSDALDMGGAGGAATIEETAVAAVDAGMDLLLLVHPVAVEDAVLAALVRAVDSGRLDAARLEEAWTRIHHVRARLAGIVQPPLEVVGCEEHRALAREIAERSVTLVRDPEAMLPPADLTPAETSSYLVLGLGAALRARGLAVDELVTPLDPRPAEVAALAAAVESHAVAIVGTFDAVSFPGQRALVQAIARRRRGASSGARSGTLAVALRSPYDVALYPDDIAAACTYGIQAPQVEALADALVGRIPFAGRLPVELPGEPPAEPPAAEPPAAEPPAAEPPAAGTAFHVPAAEPPRQPLTGASPEVIG